MANDLKLYQMFNGISELPMVDWERFQEDLKYKKYSKGEFFLKKGKMSTEIAFIIKGVFRLYSSNEKKELNYNFFAEGQFAVDYESYLRNEPSAFSIQALEDCEVYVFTKAHLLKQYNISHAWEKFGRIISEQVFLKSRDRLKELMFMSAEERYLKFVRNNKVLHNRLPLYHIASYLVVDPTSLSRIRKGKKQM